MSKNNEISITFRAKTQEAAESIKRAAQSIEDLRLSGKKAKKDLDGAAGSIKKAGKSAEGAKRSFSDLAFKFNNVRTAFNNAMGYIRGAYNFFREGAEIETARKGFEAYAASMGKNSEEILGALRKAANGTIANKDLILTANRAMALGVTADAGKMAKLLEVARHRAVLMGTDATSAFNDITVGIARMSPIILDNLGIRIPSGFAKMTEGMDDAKKMSLLLEEVIKMGGAEIEKMGGIAESSKDSFNKFETSLTELKSAIAEGLLPVSLEFVEGLKEMVKWGGEAAQFTSWLTGGSVYVATNWQSQGVSSTIAALRRQIEEKKAERETVKKHYQEWNAARAREEKKGESKAVEVATAEIKKLEYQYRQLNREIENCEKVINNVKEAAHQQNAAFKKAVEQSKEYFFKLPGMLTANGIGTVTTEVGIKKGKSQQAFDSLLEGFNAGLLKSIGTVDLKTKMGEMAKTMLNAQMAASGFVGQIDKVAAEEYRLAAEVEKADKAFESWLAKENQITELGVTLENMSRLDFSKSAEGLKKMAGNADEVTKASADMMLMAANAMMKVANPIGTTSAVNAFGQVSDSAVIARKSSGDVKSDAREAYDSIKAKLAKDFADSVSTGIVNSNIAGALSSFGSSLSSAISQSYASKNPIIASGGGFNFSNFLGGFAISAATGWLASKIGGIWKNNGKEIKTKYADIKTGVTQNYLNSYSSELNPYLSAYDVANLENARNSAHGVYIGYKYSRTWYGKKKYSLVDNGASTAMTNLADAIDSAGASAKKAEQGLEMLSSKGLDFQALTKQMEYYRSAMDRLWKIPQTATYTWDDTGTERLDLSDDIHKLKTTFEELTRTLGEAKAERTTSVNNAFQSLYPWVGSIDEKTDDYSFSKYIKTGSLLNRKLKLIEGHLPGISVTHDIGGMAAAGAYDIFSRLQEGFLDRNASSAIFDIVKQAGANKYELSALQYSDPTAYTEQYLKQLDKQLNAYAEVMRRSEEIYRNATNTFEQQSAALEDYQQAQENYYNTKLEILAQERAKEEQLKKEQQQANLRSVEKMEALLGFTGEISKTGDRVYILQGGDQVGALKELLSNYRDDPEAVAALQAMLKSAQNKNKFGKI